MRGGALEPARIDTESFADGKEECKDFNLVRGKERRKKKLEARSGIEPPMRVLQTHALPLGYRAIRCCTQSRSPENEKPTCQVFRRWAAIPRG